MIKKMGEITYVHLSYFNQVNHGFNFCIYFQLIPQISSLTPITTLLPLVGVLSMTAAKDLYDDIVCGFGFNL